MDAEIDAVNMMRDVTVHVIIKRGTELEWRLWIGARLIGLAALVMNCKIIVAETNETTK